jgi:hypothetical protein
MPKQINTLVGKERAEVRMGIQIMPRTRRTTGIAQSQEGLWRHISYTEYVHFVALSHHPYPWPCV